MTEQRQLIVFPRGQLTAKDRERLTKMGFCALEADDPKAVRLISPEVLGAPMPASDLFNVALQAIAKHGNPPAYGTTVQNTFVQLLAELMRRQSDEGATNAD